jgi:hypothetical protein
VSPIASRNIANILILVGAAPILLWLVMLLFNVLVPGAVLPWVSAAVLMSGVPLGLLSFGISVPVLLFARRRTTENAAVWSGIHRVPYFVGVTALCVAIALGFGVVILSVVIGNA